MILWAHQALVWALRLWEAAASGAAQSSNSNWFKQRIMPMRWKWMNANGSWHLNANIQGMETKHSPTRVPGMSFFISLRDFLHNYSTRSFLLLRDEQWNKEPKLLKCLPLLPRSCKAFAWKSHNSQTKIICIKIFSLHVQKTFGLEAVKVMLSIKYRIGRKAS